MGIHHGPLERRWAERRRPNKANPWEELFLQEGMYISLLVWEHRILQEERQAVVDEKKKVQTLVLDQTAPQADLTWMKGKEGDHLRFKILLLLDL